uniref:Uncharacterized protein n=1 Tax=Pyxicephalus adspersus TaxID=30357 RepID=A0AAV3A2V0_PYXAD|nr:TPA: hypothetical protein GDO54_016185 [Pyxicephalus adspersus]
MRAGVSRWRKIEIRKRWWHARHNRDSYWRKSYHARISLCSASFTLLVFEYSPITHQIIRFWEGNSDAKKQNL